MAMNFPDTPTTNQVFTDPTSGQSYRWNGQAWLGYSNLDAAKYARLTARPNILHNGDFSFNQRGVASPVTTAGAYVGDQWVHAFTPAGVQFSSSLIGGVTASGPLQVGRNRLRILCTTAKTTFAAGDYYQVYQPLEAFHSNVLMRYGQASAQPSVIRFGFKGPAGTYGVSLNVVGGVTGAASWAGSFTISAAQANLDTIQVLPVPPGTLGTGWAVGTSYGMSLRFCLATGSTYTGALGWNASQSVLAPAGAFNFLSSTSNVIEIFDVSWVPDPDNLGVDPGYQAVDYETELLRCRRYWQQFQATFSLNAASASQSQYTTFQIHPMRVAPTCNVTTAGALTNVAASTLGALSNQTAYHMLQATAAGQCLAAGRVWELDAALV